ncbi:kelch repeat-containing protein [Toxoplasma gondii TgCatPRC2]|uniref:Kelch repeat-containing protein n=1 Tax=Toxoplasma gondii TgCatPRC2 TaxID=1130821 RepID=A0A151HEE2_TOXGO|nr:kelch repeat-containing protein [Toxoplasma gondii TgCatPRC2]
MSDISDFSESAFSKGDSDGSWTEDEGAKQKKKSAKRSLFGLGKASKTADEPDAGKSDSADKNMETSDKAAPKEETKKAEATNEEPKKAESTKEEPKKAEATKAVEKKAEATKAVEKKADTKQPADTKADQASSKKESARSESSKLVYGDSASGILSPPDFFFSSIVHDGKVFTARTEHVVVQLEDTIYIWGGRQSDTMYNDLISFDPPSNTFSTIAAEGSKPPARSGASLVGRIEGGRGILTLWGGEEKDELTNKAWNFDTKTNTWSKLTTKSTPSARKGHSLCSNSDTLYLFGGVDATGVKEDGYVLKKDMWTRLKGDKVPPARCFHTATIAKTEKVNAMIVFGGDLSGNGRATNDLWRYDLRDEEWRLIDSASGETPAPRFKHASAFYEGRVWICGGQTSGWFTIYEVSDFFAYDVSGNYWFKCDVAAKQLGYHSNFGPLALFPQTKALYVFGGSSSYGKPTSDVYRLAPVCTTFSVLDVRRDVTETATEVKQVREEVEKSAATAAKVMEFVEKLEKNMSVASGKVSDLSRSVNDFQKEISSMVANSTSCMESVEQVRKKLDNIEGKFVAFAQLERRCELIESSITELLRKLDEKADRSALRKITDHIQISDTDEDSD